MNMYLNCYIALGHGQKREEFSDSLIPRMYDTELIHHDNSHSEVVNILKVIKNILIAPVISALMELTPLRFASANDLAIARRHHMDNWLEPNIVLQRLLWNNQGAMDLT